ncbi:MAG: hypothetical protein R3E50_04475 [Halioglobus sp.]
MRTGLVVVALAGLLNSGWVVACDIVNKQEIQVGETVGVGGQCANNGQTIQCLRDGDGGESFTCSGPEGDFSGPDLQALIATACGCAAAEDDGASEQLDEELGD